MTKHSTRLTLLFCVAALAFASFGASSALAAVSLSVQATHSPAVFSRGDQYLDYSVTVKNTGNTTAPGAANPVTLAINTPPGVTLDKSSGTEWTCAITPQTCSSSTSAAANANLPVLKLSMNVDPSLVPDTLTTTFTAAGGGAAVSAIAEDSFVLGPQLTFGLTSFAASAKDGLGADYTQAGGHPLTANTSFAFTTRTDKKNTLTGMAFENVRDLAVNLPPGFVGNPQVLPGGGCLVQEVATGVCPARFAIGRTFTRLIDFTAAVDQKSPVYKLAGEKGAPAQFAFKPVGLGEVTIILKAKVRPGDFGVTALVPSPPMEPDIKAVEYFTFCSYGVNTSPALGAPIATGCKAPGDAGALANPFLTAPTRCNGQPDVTSIDVASYQHPGAKDIDGFPNLTDPNWKSYEAASPAITGCNQLEFEPSVTGRPTTNVADAPSGLDFSLSLPQDGLLDPQGLATAHLKRAEVTLPEGMAVNPSAADGLQACSSSQMGLLEVDHPGAFPIRFDGQPVSCPDAAKVGTVEIVTPVLDQVLKGTVYLAQQDDPATPARGAENPFDSLLALYIVVANDDLGIRVKLAGQVTPDPVTGQLTTVFDPNPQLPFSRLDLKISEGARATLRTPATCGPKTTRTQLTPWSAPESGPPATPVDSFAIVASPTGGSCPTEASQLPNAPRFTAGTVVPRAGAYSPFVLRLSREDGSQELKGLSATLPPGLTGRLAGVPYCPEAAIAAAIDRDEPGQGKLEQANPSCPAASEVGSVDAAAGAGPLPYHAAGKAYLAGPYKGAPVSMVVITPAVAGPFDLGSVVVRNALYVDPVTAQVSVKSDPIPTILKGIPLDLRSLEVSVNRDQFTLNPTNCEPLSITALAAGVSSEATLSDRFQVGECSALGFKPRLRLQLKGGVKRGAHPALTATLTPRPGDANIASASVALPHSAFLDQAHIKTICTRVQFAAHACPPGSVYGFAEATTPLLDNPVSGPVYLRSSSNPLPDLVMALRGPDSQPIEVVAAGRVDSVNGGIRNSFELVPDAPVSKLILQMQGGKKGLLVNSRDLCKGKPQRAVVKMVGQNGRRLDSSILVEKRCGKKRSGRKGGGARVSTRLWASLGW